VPIDERKINNSPQNKDVKKTRVIVGHKKTNKKED